MTTLLLNHEAFLHHDPGPHHPECSDRARVIDSILKKDEFQSLVRRQAPRATVDQIALAHDPKYVATILASIPIEGYRYLDSDTVISPGSGDAAICAVGAVTAAVDAVVGEDLVDNAFCAVRPPGHHAEYGRSMGFCIFNNVAVGAQYARVQRGLTRAAVIDFDVHHGNGTQHLFEDDQELFYASTHQAPFYPGTGGRDEVGVGNIFNIPLLAGAGSIEFRKAFEIVVLPALQKFDPDIIFISAGFDAHADDPLAQLRLEVEDYAWVTRQILAVAKVCCQGRVISTLEGGYDLEALRKSVGAHVSELMLA